MLCDGQAIDSWRKRRKKNGINNGYFIQIKISCCFKTIDICIWFDFVYIKNIFFFSSSDPNLCLLLHLSVLLSITNGYQIWRINLFVIRFVLVHWHSKKKKNQSKSIEKKKIVRTTKFIWFVHLICCKFLCFSYLQHDLRTNNSSYFISFDCSIFSVTTQTTNHVIKEIRPLWKVHTKSDVFIWLTL